ncbi:SDR family NAD(P)-dependent oxidoreductase [Mycolicibacterium vaccae]|uniref:SDR family NAD(P)-dependent oxidoreductase n=1 Tax=Mycolicibacterium vaccae TaxID=1810 RepID=UPI003CFF4501
MTGAKGGLGGAIALALAQQGVDLVLSDRPGQGLSALVPPLQQFGVTVATVEADLTDRSASPNLISAAEEELGPLDILINNAGMEVISPWNKRTPENIGAEIELNLIAPMLLTQAALPGMVSRGRGHILTISSIGGMLALPYLLGYAASKHGIAAYNRALAGEVREHGVRVTTVFPGLVRDAGMGARYTDWLVPPRYRKLTTKTPQQVGAAVVKGLRTGQSELVVSATPARPLAVLTAIRPEITIGIFEGVRRQWGPILDANLGYDDALSEAR